MGAAAQMRCGAHFALCQPSYNAMSLIDILTTLEFFSPSDDLDENDMLAETPVPLAGSDPVRPWITLKFNHAIAPNAYAIDVNWSSYFLLTSLTHPASANQTLFTDFSWQSNHSELIFRPASPLVPGDEYLASLSGKLRDSAGRCIARSYTWTFTCSSNQVDNSQIYAPAVTLISPVDQTSQSSLPALTWTIDSNFNVPAGYRLAFNVNAATDQQMTSLVWSETALSIDGTAIAYPGTHSNTPAALTPMQSQIDSITQTNTAIALQLELLMEAYRNPTVVNQTDVQTITSLATTAAAPLPVPAANKNVEVYTRILTANLTDYAYSANQAGRIVQQTFVNAQSSGAFTWTIIAHAGETFSGPDLAAIASFTLANGESRTFTNTSNTTWTEL